MEKDFKPREFRKEDGKLSLADVVTPIFDAQMGRRLALARMSRMWKQKELAEKLGLNRETLGRLEAGIIGVPRHAFSVSKLEDVLGEMVTKYVIMDRYGATFSAPEIHAKFWNKVYRGRPKPKGEHWTRAQIKAGRSVQGSTFMGIPGEVWDEANRIHRKREKIRTKTIK